MAFKLKRHRLKRKKKLLSKKERIKRMLALIKKGLRPARKKKIKSKKLNNNKQNEIAVAIYNGDANLKDLTMGHLASAAGSYRKGRIDNKKA